MRTFVGAMLAASLIISISALVVPLAGRSATGGAGMPVYLAAGDARSSVYVIYPETKTAYLCGVTGTVQEPWSCQNLGTHP